MKAAELLAMYERVADAPDAVEKLRRFVLELAVRGKLESQATADCVARLSPPSPAPRKGGKRAPKTVAPAGASLLASSTELNFSLPAGWVAARLHQVAECLDYMRRPVNSADRDKRTAGKGPDELFPYYGATQQQGWIDDFLFDEELLLLGEDGIPFFDPYSPKAYTVSGRTWVNNHAHVFRCTNVLPRFLVHYLNIFDYTGRVVGATRAKLNQAAALEIPVPLPPMSEQRRIVAKVDELMALCDQLEAARKEREAARDRLVAASLARLNAPDPDPDTFQADARFALNVLPALCARPDQVKQLRQTILNLAVRGKLVKQDPADEPASELLRRVSSARRLSTAEQNQRIEGEMGAMRPRGWEQVVLSQVCDFVTSGSRGWAEYYATTGAWFIRAQNIRFGTLLLENLACVRPPKSAEGSRTQVQRGDLLIVITGAGVTNPALFDQDLGEAYISQHVALVRPNDRQLSRWLLLCMMADEGGRAELVRCAYGSGKPGLNLDNIRTLRSPLPPLAEQDRIVAKVDELMALCDQLEESLNGASTARSCLLNALLHEAIASTGTAA